MAWKTRGFFRFLPVASEMAGEFLSRPTSASTIPLFNFFLKRRSPPCHRDPGTPGTTFLPEVQRHRKRHLERHSAIRVPDFERLTIQRQPLQHSLREDLASGANGFPLMLAKSASSSPSSSRSKSPSE
jgi:hypothetical protein